MWLNNKILRGILYKDNIACCLCLQTTADDALSVYDKVSFPNAGSELQLSSIIWSVFNNKISETEFISDAVCDECVKSAISAYKFIQKCTEINRMLRSTVCNITENLAAADYKNVIKAEGMYIAVDPKGLQSKTYYDTKTTVESISILLRRFRLLVRAEQFYKNEEDANNKVEEKKNKSCMQKSDRVSCELCGRSCSNKYTLKNHMLKSCKKFKSMKCKAEDISLLANVRCRRPQKSKARSNKKKRKCKEKFNCDNYCCHYCDKTFKRKTLLKIHIHHHCQSTPKDSKQSVCSVCGKVVNSYAMAVHQQIHSPPFECTKCSKVFKTKRAYKKHMLILNCNEKPLEFIRGPKDFCCHVCGSEFSVKRSLSDHIKARHSGPGFECTVCNKKLATQYALKLHMVVHTKEKNFVCTVCGGKFVSRHSLLYHTRTHTGEKPYKCKFCEGRFLSASRRNIHIRIHHLPPQLECKYCMKKFTNWGTLNRHRKRHFNPGSSLYLEDLDELIKLQNAETGVEKNMTGSK